MLEVKDTSISVSGKVLVQNLSLIAPDGEITCITGSEGSGKTVFLRTLMGFHPVADGFVSVDGELLTPQSAPAFRRFMCYLPQNINLLRHQLYPIEATTVEPEEYGVWNVELPPIAETSNVEPLSPEEVFSLASQTITDAVDKPILIADEPASFLSPDLALQMLQLLQSQAKQGKCVLIASRHPQLIAYSNRVINLDQLSVCQH